MLNYSEVKINDIISAESHNYDMLDEGVRVIESIRRANMLQLENMYEHNIMYFIISLTKSIDRK